MPKKKKRLHRWLNLKAAAVTSRILKASEMAKALEEKEAELKPTLQKLMSSSGSQTKVNLKEMSQEANREKVKGMPRWTSHFWLRGVHRLNQKQTEWTKEKVILFDLALNLAPGLGSSWYISPTQRAWVLTRTFPCLGSMAHPLPQPRFHLTERERSGLKGWNSPE